MLESGKERIIIIAPHADDEVLGCGGLIEKACRTQNEVKVVLGAIGDTHFWHANGTIASTTRKQEFADAMTYLGCKNYEIMYEDKESWMDTIPQRELVTKIDRLITDFRPTMAFIPYPSFHQDHQALFQACMAGLRPRPDLQIKLIAMFEYPFIVWQYPKIHDVGEFYLDISATVEKKVESLKKHRSQLREDSHMISPDTVRQWAKMRGLECGVAYAEKYYLMKGQFL